jgi:hypothetical protein
MQVQEQSMSLEIGTALAPTSAGITNNGSGNINITGNLIGGANGPTQSGTWGTGLLLQNAQAAEPLTINGNITGGGAINCFGLL